MPIRSSYNKTANARKKAKSATSTGKKATANQKAAGVRSYAKKSARRRSVTR